MKVESVRLTWWIIPCLVCGINFTGLHLLFLISKQGFILPVSGSWPQLWKVIIRGTAESNYHVLNGLTPLHLHPPLFHPSYSFLWRWYWAKITLCNAHGGSSLEIFPNWLENYLILLFFFLTNKVEWGVIFLGFWYKYEDQKFFSFFSLSF